MGTITKNHTFSSGATIVAAEHNSNFDTVYNAVNGNINTDNIHSSAGILDTQLNAISTAGKVNLSALIITSQAAGDLVYASSNAALTRLAAGTIGNILTSAGTAAPEWTTLPTGTVLQVVNVQDGSVATGTDQYTDDDDIPTSAQGTEYMTLAVTPAATANELLIDTVAHVSTNNTATMAASLYKGAGTAAITTSMFELKSSSADMQVVSFRHKMVGATTAETTFKLRMGTVGAGTLTFNGVAGSQKFGGTLASSMTITEIAG